MTRTFGLLLLLAAIATPQDAKKPATLKKLPKGQTRVYEAIVMKVVGVAQARAGKKAKWAKLKINDVLKPGTTVRTGRKSLVALRVGPNATMVIDRQTRVSIPQIIQDGDKLKTKIGVQFGRVDVKATRLGLAIDFSVATPSATLAVRGTAFRIEWDAIRSYRARGIPGNRIRAIEIEYLRGLKATLSKADSTSEQNPMPAFDAFWSTYIVPLEGAITPEALDDPRIQPTDLSNPVEESGLKAINQLRGGKVLPPPREGPDPVPPTSDNPLPQKP